MVAEKQERTRQRLRWLAVARGFERFEAEPVVIDAETSADSEADISSDAEDLVWKETAQDFQDIFITEDMSEKNKAAHRFLFTVLRLYFQAALSTQIAALMKTWCEANSSVIRVEDVDLARTGERLEEPLCWRSIPNDADLEVFAADLLVWGPESMEQEASRTRKTSRRGFEQPSSTKESRGAASRYVWSALKLIIHDFCLISGRTGDKPRVLLSEETIVSLKKLGVKDPEMELGLDRVEMHVYSRTPSWEQLVSESNSLVLVFFESPSPDLCWSLPEPPGSPDRERTRFLDTAPILLFSFDQLDVKFNIPGIMQKVRRWLIESEDHESLAETDEDVVAQWTSFLFLPFGNEFISTMKVRRDYVRSRLGGLVRKVFANKRAKLRAKRLPQLLEAQQRMTRQMRRQRELRAKAEIVFAELEEAIRKLDWEGYDKKLSQARGDKLFDTQRLQDVETCWAKAVHAAEVPLQNMLQQCLDADDVLLVIPELRETLAASKVPLTSHWLQAAVELNRTLEALQNLQGAAAALESGTSSSSSSAPGELSELSQEIQNAEARLDGFERALRKARGKVEPDVTRPFQPLLERSKQIWRSGRDDENLQEVLNAVPWERSKRLFAGITTAALETLQAAASAASAQCTSRMKDALDEAFAVAEVAKRLRRALRGHDDILLGEILKEAEKNGLLGLDGPRQRWEELQSAKSAMRLELATSVSMLDIAAFELHASRNVAQLPTEELQALREELEDEIIQEETALQEVLVCTVTEKSLGEVLQKCRLLPSNRWRRAAQDSLKALEAAKGIREVLKLEPVDETILQANLSSGGAASKELSLSLQQVKELQDQGELKSAFQELQRALDEGYLGLAGAQKDQSLETLLNSPPWREPHWEVIQPSDLRQLELRVQEASKDGQERLAQEVQRALEVGQCAVDLSNAFLLLDLEKLERLYSKALDLKMSGLEKVQAKIQRLASRRARSSRSAIAPKVALQSPNATLSRTQTLESASAEEYESEEVRDVRCQNLIFLDLELTSGFYDFEDESEILEVAVIVTDKDMDELDRGHWVLGGFSRQDLENLGDFHKANFRDAEPGGEFPPFGPDGGNGLFSDVLASRLSLEQVESEVMELIERHCPLGECPLVGYSVQCDREVIKDKMPRLYRHLSHQIIDVSGFFTVARYWLPDRWQDWDRRSTSYNHRALNDAADAIEAMRWVRQKFFSADWPPQELKQLSSMKF